ncbi:unnamed protein product [Spirodela intermedia]|uniref:Exostosin GT47 domain-containing protein n=1 Tax=Spirodela intermedia TaxID=51605 RepID=A0A7I8IQV3_SPIIN|nr:unnamed protein product [Spirodela intermedia]CAA6659916.1 unnamed protein product [Spirodela intermedia]
MRPEEEREREREREGYFERKGEAEEGSEGGEGGRADGIGGENSGRRHSPVLGACLPRRFLLPAGSRGPTRRLLPVSCQIFPLKVRHRPPPLKVYMYDLPRRFNVGMLERRRPDAGGTFLVEYWMMASLLAEEGGAGGEVEAVRVLKGEEAEVFFVPFFSSLSFNTHGHNMTDPDTMIDRQLQEDLLTFLRGSPYWQRSGGRDHVIPMHHPNAFRFLRQQVNVSILVVADFGRYPKSLSSLARTRRSPDPFLSRPTLLFFRGRTVRKDSTHGMRTSKFCLHPAGDTPSSCRLFDAIISHCVPVVVSDHIELPFEDELDYLEFSVFFSVQEALRPGFMWARMWRRLKEISCHFEYQYPQRRTML